MPKSQENNSIIFFYCKLSRINLYLVGLCNCATNKQSQVRSCIGPTGGGQPCAGNTTSQEISCQCSDAANVKSTLELMLLTVVFYTIAALM